MTPDAAAWQWECDVPFARGAPDWAAVLQQLDAASLMAPPLQPGVQRTPQGEMAICNDGAPWKLTVRGNTGETLVQDQQSCGARDSTRAQFERSIEAVLDALAAQAERK
ncbi:MAG: hypothetical protein ACREOC_19230 [Gemmatimonadales bacterium]